MSTNNLTHIQSNLWDQYGTPINRPTDGRWRAPIPPEWLNDITITIPANEWNDIFSSSDNESDTSSDQEAACEQWRSQCLKAQLQDMRNAFAWQTGDVSIYKWLFTFCRRNWASRFMAHGIATRLSMLAIRMHDATQMEEWKTFLNEKNYLFPRPCLNRHDDEVLTLIENTLQAIIDQTEEPYMYIRYKDIPYKRTNFQVGTMLSDLPTSEPEESTKDLLDPPLRAYQDVFIYMYSFFKNGKLTSNNAKEFAKMITNAWEEQGMNTDVEMSEFWHSNRPFDITSFTTPIRLITNMIANMDNLNIYKVPADLRSFTTDQVIDLSLQMLQQNTPRYKLQVKTKNEFHFQGIHQQGPANHQIQPHMTREYMTLQPVRQQSQSYTSHNDNGTLHSEDYDIVLIDEVTCMDHRVLQMLETVMQQTSS